MLALLCLLLYSLDAQAAGSRGRRFFLEKFYKERTAMGDPVNHPAHYTFGKFEVIDVPEDFFPADPLLWQVGKYIARFPIVIFLPIINMEA